MQELEVLDLRVQSGSNGEETLEDKATLSKELEEIAKAEEIHWRQKSRFLWIEQGDKNTRYFHKIANANRRYNWIDKLEINGEMIEDKKEIKEHILGFYKDLFTEYEDWRPQWDDADLAAITEDEKEWLQRPFHEAEVRNVIDIMEGDKAPGPDGFNMNFFKRCWTIVKEDVTFGQCS